MFHMFTLALVSKEQNSKRLVKMPCFMSNCRFTQLSRLAASGPLTSAATCASETSALNFRALFHDELQYFVLYNNALCDW